MSSYGCQPKKIPCNYHHSFIAPVLLRGRERERERERETKISLIKIAKYVMYNNNI